MKKLIQTLLLTFTFASIATTSTFARNGTLLGVVKQHIHYGNLQNLKTLWTPSLTTPIPPVAASEFPKILPTRHLLELQELAQQQLSDSLLAQLDIAGTPTARAEILQKYLHTAAQLIQDLQLTKEKEQTSLTLYQEKRKTCEANANKLNQEFQARIKQYEAEKAESIVEKIVQERSCAAANKVYYKQHVLYRDLLQSSLISLQKRHSYLQQQQEMILQYYEVMKPQLLKELYTISRTMQANF